MSHKFTTILVAVIVSFIISGCVSKNAFKMMEDEASRLATELHNLHDRHEELKEARAEIFRQHEALEKEKVELVTDNQQLSLILAARSDSLSEIITDLRYRIENLAEKNRDLRNEVEELRQAKEQEVELLSNTYEELLSKMKSEVDKGQITISELKGKLTVNMVDAILFDSGKAEVKDEGMQILQKVVDILKNVTDKAIRVEGHTDNVKIGEILARRYPTNWELSSSRAVNVARFLQDQGLNPENLRAVAFGEYSPVADNDTEEGRARNRRIEIVLVAKDR